MTKRFLPKTAIIALIMVIAAALALTAGTLAWFTSNQTVNTEYASARTGTTDVELLLSSSETSGFAGTCDIRQVNDYDKSVLLPVSTDNLTSFVYKVGGDTSSEYSLVTDDQRYYRGRIYLRARATGASGNSKLALYLDDSTRLFGSIEESLATNALRVGLLFSDGSSVIIQPSVVSNPSAKQAHNTYVNGSLVDDGKVLHSTGTSAVTVVSDPSVTLDEIGIGSNPTARPLMTMNLNETYSLDIFCYIEGCDPDCSNSIQFMESDIQLAFYGALVGDSEV